MDSGLELEGAREALRRYCLSLAKNGWEAEDLEQEAWCRALASRDWSNHSNREALLLRIARNLWTDRLRKEAIRRRVLPELIPAQTEEPPGSWELPEMLQALECHFSPLQLAVWLLREVMGYSISETAELISTTEGAVKAASHRARRALEKVRQELKSEGFRETGDQSLLSRLHALAAALRTGEAAAIAALAEQDALEPVIAAGMLSSPVTMTHLSPVQQVPQASMGRTSAAVGSWQPYSLLAG